MGFRDPKKPIPDPGSRGRKSTGSRFRISNTDFIYKGYTPLHHCLSLYWSPATMALARLLLEHGADPNAKTRHGAVPLYECVISDNVESVKLLLEFGVICLFSLFFVKHLNYL
jgi:hypothetical protein